MVKASFNAFIMHSLTGAKPRKLIALMLADSICLGLKEMLPLNDGAY